MASILIENLKPIAKVAFDIKQVNLFIGPQSSGKSTILKVICFCRWLEKHIYNDESKIAYYQSQFINLLCSFHRIDTKAISKDTHIYYKGDFLSVTYSGDKENASININDAKSNSYQNNKLAYIPSERNLASAIPNIKDSYKATIYDNIFNYISEWNEARQSYQNRFSVPNLNIKYSYHKEGDKDKICLNENEEISLELTSSGFQSVIPLYILLDYYTKVIFRNNPKLPTINERISFEWRYEKEPESIKEAKTFEEYLSEKRLYIYSQLFIEEPEQNLFPSTQTALLDDLIKGVLSNDRNNYLFMSTHSPYILTRLNNLIEAHETGKIYKDKVSNLIAEDYWLPFDNVNAFFVDNGTIEDLKNDEYKIIDGSNIDIISETMNELHYQLQDLKDE